MLDAIGAAPGSHSEIDWSETWRSSPEHEAVQAELLRLRTESTEKGALSDVQEDPASYAEFAAPLWDQFVIVTERVFQQSWRSPAYIYPKFLLCISTSLFIGLVFLDAPLTIQGLQNQMFSIFELMSIVGQLVDQQMPNFITQRNLYEVRERPAKTYSWKIFMLSQILSEIPWSALASVFMWVLFYYPVGFNKNAEAAGQGTERAGLMWLLFMQFLIWVSTFTNLCISFSDTADAGGNVGNLLFVLIFFFCGVLASPDQMPRFWIFLYRMSPLSYFVSAVLSTGLANVEVHCASNEYTPISLPEGKSCGAYMADYISRAGGYVEDASSTTLCNYCKIKDTNVFLAHINADYSTRWRNFGILWAYIAFNIIAAMGLYWLARVPKGKRKI